MDGVFPAFNGPSLAARGIGPRYAAWLSPFDPRCATIAAAVLHITQQKEQFSIAFIRAVTTVAGFNISRCDVDDDSIDIGVCGTRRDGTRRKAPKLDIQAKCTEADNGEGDDLPFDLKLKNYDDLRDPDAHAPAILIVVCVPASVDEWLTEAAEQTALRRCAYWYSLRGFGASSNTTKERVRIPRVQRFTVEALRAIMTRIGDGGFP